MHRKPPYLEPERLDVMVPRTAMARLGRLRERLGANPGEIVGALLRVLPDDRADELIADLLERDRQTCAEYVKRQRSGT